MKRMIVMALFLNAGLLSASNHNEGIFGYEYDNKDAQHVYVKFELGYVNNRASLVGLNNFFKSYNIHYQDFLTEPFESSYLGASPYAALGFGSRYFTMQMNYTYFDQRMSSTLISGEGRDYRLVLHGINLEWDFVVPWRFPLTFGFTVGGNFDKGRLYSAYRYADGSQSYGSDKILNGIYRIKSSGNSFGMKLVWQTNWGDIYFRGETYSVNFSGTHLPIRDYQHGYAVYASNFTPPLYHTDDVEVENDQNVYYVGRDHTISSDFKGARYTIGLTFYLKGK